jgi:hypothetical protein
MSYKLCSCLYSFKENYSRYRVNLLSQTPIISAEKDKPKTPKAHDINKNMNKRETREILIKQMQYSIKGLRTCKLSYGWVAWVRKAKPEKLVFCLADERANNMCVGDLKDK